MNYNASFNNSSSIIPEKINEESTSIHRPAINKVNVNNKVSFNNNTNQGNMLNDNKNIPSNLNIQNQKDYNTIISYLISQLNNNNNNNCNNNIKDQENLDKDIPIFLYEFFIFDLYLPTEILSQLKQPILALRLLDFPTLTLQGNVVLPKKKVIFNQGKSSFFEMDLNELKDNLVNIPMYIMLIDLNYGDMKILCSCRLNVSIFSYDTFLCYGEGMEEPKPRRNILGLFDNTMTKIGEVDVSLLIRREYYKFEKKRIPQENNLNNVQYAKSQSLRINNNVNKDIFNINNKKLNQLNQIILDKNIQFQSNNNKNISQPNQNAQNAINDMNIINTNTYNKMTINTSPNNNNNYNNNNINDYNSNYNYNNYNNNYIDSAYNAHAVNKEMVLPKKKKIKRPKSNMAMQTDELDAFGIPINAYNIKVEYENRKKLKEKPKKVRKEELNDAQEIMKMYNKAQNKFTKAVIKGEIDMGNYYQTKINSKPASKQGTKTNFYLDKNMGTNHKTEKKSTAHSRYAQDINENNNNSQTKPKNIKDKDTLNFDDSNEYLKLVNEIRSKLEAYKNKNETDIENEEINEYDKDNKKKEDIINIKKDKVDTNINIKEKINKEEKIKNIGSINNNKNEEYNINKNNNINESKESMDIKNKKISNKNVNDNFKESISDSNNNMSSRQNVLLQRKSKDARESINEDIISENYNDFIEKVPNDINEGNEVSTISNMISSKIISNTQNINGNNQNKNSKDIKEIKEVLQSSNTKSLEEDEYNDFEQNLSKNKSGVNNSHQNTHQNVINTTSNNQINTENNIENNIENITESSKLNKNEDIENNKNNNKNIITEEVNQYNKFTNINISKSITSSQAIPEESLAKENQKGKEGEIKEGININNNAYNNHNNSISKQIESSIIEESNLNKNNKISKERVSERSDTAIMESIFGTNNN